MAVGLSDWRGALANLHVQKAGGTALVPDMLFTPSVCVWHARSRARSNTSAVTVSCQRKMELGGALAPCMYVR